MTRNRTYGGRCMCPVCECRVSFGPSGRLWHHKNKRDVFCPASGMKYISFSLSKRIKRNGGLCAWKDGCNKERVSKHHSYCAAHRREITTASNQRRKLKKMSDKIKDIQKEIYP